MWCDIHQYQSCYTDGQVVRRSRQISGRFIQVCAWRGFVRVAGSVCVCVSVCVWGVRVWYVSVSGCVCMWVCVGDWGGRNNSSFLFAWLFLYSVPSTQHSSTPFLITSSYRFFCSSHGLLDTPPLSPTPLSPPFLRSSPASHHISLTPSTISLVIPSYSVPTPFLPCSSLYFSSSVWQGNSPLLLFLSMKLIRCWGKENPGKCPVLPVQLCR